MMDTFGSLLRQQIKQSGYTIYQIAQKADINRTTLQKTLTDDRLFSSEILLRILDFLKLTPTDYTHLTTAYTIAQIGAPTYYRRLYVKELISSLQLIDQTSCILPVSKKQVISLDLSNKSLKIFRGQSSVLFLLKTLFEHELYTHDTPFIYLYGLTNTPILNEILSLTNMNHNGIPLNIKHLVHFIMNPDTENTCNTNLQLLAELLPFTLSFNSNYEVFYTYVSTQSITTSAQIFPYYIILHDCVIRLSNDATAASLCQDDDLATYYQEQFLNYVATAHTLIKPNPNANQLLQHVMHIDQATSHAYCIQYQPCFFPFVDTHWVELLVKKDVPYRKEFCTLVTTRIEQMKSFSAYSFFFKPSGLKLLAEEGIIAEFPLDFVRPLTPEERFRLLNILYQACQSSTNIIRAINESKFVFSDSIYVSIHGKKDIMFTGVDSLSKRLRYTFISECSLFDAFLDYFTILPDTDYVYSQEDTLKLIANYRDELANDASNEISS